MKRLLIVLVAMVLFSGCGMSAKTPYMQIATTDSQIFTYTDADVSVGKDTIKSDDTTVMIIGVRDNTGADLASIFNTAMGEIKEIFKARQAVYESWVGRE